MDNLYDKSDECIPAVAYRRAFVPVLETFRGMLKADALFLWEIFDFEPSNQSENAQKISEYEKDRLCRTFYNFLAEKQKSIVDELLSSIEQPSNESPDSSIATLETFLNGRYCILKFTELVTHAGKLDPPSLKYGEEARPRKYVVLYDAVADKLASVPYKPTKFSIDNGESASTNPLMAVKLEGISAFHARTKTDGIYEKDELAGEYKNISLGLNHDRIVLKRKKGGAPIDRCDHLCVLPLLYSGRVIGILKAETYDKSNPFKKENIDLVRVCLPFFAQFIIESRTGMHALTYEKLCKGEKLEALLISTREDLLKQDKNLTNNEIGRLLENTIHLFNVFNRRTYIGWGDIAGRIDHYVEEITPILSLPKLDILSLFRELGKYDEILMQDIPQYREHFIHQFHNFILGLLIILKIGINNFAEWTNNQLHARSLVFAKPYKKLEDRSIIRIWFYTCFFHDYAYILQEFDEAMGKFIKKVLKLDRLNVHSDWSQIFVEQSVDKNSAIKSKFAKYLKDMATYFISGEQDRDTKGIITQPIFLVDEIWNSVVTRQDHGPLSAFFLLDHLLCEKAILGIEVDEAYLAALAISCHHKEVFREVAYVGHEHFLTLEGFPFIFLLVYCDTAQEWGRRKKSETGIEYSSPVFGNLVVQKEKGEVITTICYDSSEPLKIPTPDRIKKLEESISSSFRARKYRFVIHYQERYFGENEEKDKKENIDGKEIGDVILSKDYS